MLALPVHCSAPLSVSGRAMSPSTISTFDREEKPLCPGGAAHQGAHGDTPCWESLDQLASVQPVAPVPRIIFRFLSKDLENL